MPKVSPSSTVIRPRRGNKASYRGINRKADVVKGQIGIIISAAAIIAFAVAMWRQDALGTLALVIVIASALTISSFLILTF